MRLGDLVEVRKGKKPDLSVTESLPGFRRLIQIDDLRPGAPLKYCPPTPGEVAAEASDVIIAWDGANAATSSFGLSGVIGSTLALLRPTAPSLVTAYLGHFIRAQQGFLRSRCKGATVPHIDGRVLESLDVPLPSIAEQQRIAAILDNAGALGAKRRHALNRLASLTQSVFLDMFGDPATNPRGWPQSSIGKLGTVTTGNTPPRNEPRHFGDAIEWIKSDNLNTSEYYATRAAEGLSEQGMPRARLAPSGAILITCIAGSSSSIGNASMVDRTVAFNQQINAFLPRDGNPHFFFAQLVVGKSLVQEASTGGMKGLVSKGRFERILLMEPPVELQDRFANVALRIESKRAGLYKSLARLEELFASLQHRAFAGKL